MKRFLMITLLIASVSFSLDSTIYGINVGLIPLILASPHHATATGAAAGFDTKTTFTAGISSNSKLNEKLSLGMSINYSKSSLSTHREGPADGEVLMDLYYHNLVFVPKVQYSPGYSFLISAGPSLEINLSNHLDATGEWVSQEKPIPLTNNIRLNGSFSFGYRIKIGKNILIIPEVSYNQGLTNTNDFYGGKYSNVVISTSILFR